ncbi:MAG: penicillin-binding protein [Chloroflexota bacterium]|nr:MAG: penicillin-binding protein [Chloroflexota bacterium]
MILTQRIWHVVNAVTLVLVLLSGRIVYWQLVRGQALQPVVLDPVAAAAEYQVLSGAERADPTAPVTLETLPKPVVQRTLALLAEISRGTIYDRNGQALAYDQPTGEGRKIRFYTEPSLAPVVGYVSGLRTGVSGIEHSFNESLLGLNRFDTQVSRMVYQPMTGSDVYLTIDSRIQRAASQALGNKTGAVVVLEAHTGAVLAMVSAPTFDPNRILDEAYLRSLFAHCGEGTNCPNVLLNRATQGLYVPGSTWKTVSLVAALDTGQVTPESVFDVGSPRKDAQGPYYVYEVDGGIVLDRNHTEQVLNLERAYVTSANAVFGRIGAEMPPNTLIEYAARFGFSRPDGAGPPLEIATSAAQVANDPEALNHNNFLRAITAIGQGELLTSPLNMALVAATVVNGGDMPSPHLLQAVRHPSGALLQGEPGGTWVSGVMRPETARQVRQIMIAMAQSQRGIKEALSGLTVGGKTGTAEVGSGLEPHAWFIGFAEAEGRTVAIAVVVEHGGQGGNVAAPIFAQVAGAAIQYLGEPVNESISVSTNP